MSTASSKIADRHQVGHESRKKGLSIIAKSLNLLARPAGFEPATYGFVVRHSIQLSYGRKKEGIYSRDAATWQERICKTAGFFRPVRLSLSYVD